MIALAAVSSSAGNWEEWGLGSEQLDPGRLAWGSAPRAHSHQKATFLPLKVFELKAGIFEGACAYIIHKCVVTQVFQLTIHKIVNKQGYCETHYVSYSS